MEMSNKSISLFHRSAGCEQLHCAPLDKLFFLNATALLLYCSCRVSFCFNYSTVNLEVSLLLLLPILLRGSVEFGFSEQLCSA